MVRVQYLDMRYGYDAFGNITGMANMAPRLSNGLGGEFALGFNYDTMNRLIGTKQNAQIYMCTYPPQECHLEVQNGVTVNVCSPKEVCGLVTVGNNGNSALKTMEYNDAGGIMLKNQEHSVNGRPIPENTYENVYKYYDDTHRLASVDDNVGTNGATLFKYDDNGNTVIEEGQNGQTLMNWDELNRLKMLGNRDRGVFQYNVYDDGGERRIKYTLEREADIYQNGVPLDVGGLSLVDYHIYTNPYVSVSSTRQYTKHYYAGSQRFASRVMDDAGRFEDPTPFDNFWKPAPRDTLPNKAAPATKEDALGTYLKKVGMQEEYQTELRESYWRPNLYFLHADHLGTATFVTIGRAEATQYFRNLPWGETDVEQDTGDYDNPYKFNGKELDQESGLYYYGARYYNPRLSIWYGVDPLAEKTMEPYAYAYNNPIRIIDPDGREGTDWIKKGNKFTWDDRVVDQKTATKYHPGSEYIGQAATVTTKIKSSGKILDSTHLNADGSITQNGKTITGKSIEDRSFSNLAGSTFIARQTARSFYGFSANFAAFGGFGVSIGIVSDSVDDWTTYFSFNANLGLGMGASADIGAITPTGSNQFLVSDFEGKGASYSYGISTPLVDFGGGTGGSLNSGYNSNSDYFNSSKWGENKRGYTTSQAAFSKGTGWGGGAMWTYGQTWIKK